MTKDVTYHKEMKAYNKHYNQCYTSIIERESAICKKVAETKVFSSENQVGTVQHQLVPRCVLQQ